MSDARDGSDDFATQFDRIYGSFDPRVDHVRATNTNDHYENLWVGEWGQRVKVPPRTLFLIDKIVADDSNKLRSRNDFARDAFVRAFHWRHEQVKDSNLVLASEIEVEIREQHLRTKMAQAIRLQKDDQARRDGIFMLLTGPYDLAIQVIAEEQIDALRSDTFRVECMRKLEDYRRKK